MDFEFKKALLAVAVAGSMVAMPVANAADVKVGALISVSVDNQDPDIDGKFTSDGEDVDDDLSMNSNQSSFWIKASEDLGNGVKVLAFIDNQFDPTSPGDELKGRDQYAGFQADWGRIVFGTTSTSYKSSGAAVDPWWRTSQQARGFARQISNLHSGNGRHRGRMENMIRYDSPSLSGAKFIGWVGMDDGDDNNHEYGAGIHYKGGNLFAAVDYWNGNLDEDSDSYAGQVVDGSDDDAAKLTLKYTLGNWAFWGMYEYDGGLVSFSQLKAFETGTGIGVDNDGSNDGADVIYLGTSYSWGNNLVSVGYSTRDDFGDVDDSGIDSYNISARHSVSKNTFVYAGYTLVDQDDGLEDAGFGDEPTQISVGLRTKLQ